MRTRRTATPPHAYRVSANSEIGKIGRTAPLTATGSWRGHGLSCGGWWTGARGPSKKRRRATSPRSRARRPVANGRTGPIGAVAVRRAAVVTPRERVWGPGLATDRRRYGRSVTMGNVLTITNQSTARCKIGRIGVRATAVTSTSRFQGGERIMN